MKKYLFSIFFVWMVVFTGMTIAEEPAASPATVSPVTKSFFAESSASVDKQWIGLYRKKQLTVKTEYPTLRRLAAQKIAIHHQTTMQSVWGKESQPIYAWLEKHPVFLENFLLALDGKNDDIPAAMQIIKYLVTKYPKQVEEYPDLTIAIAVVWDQPEMMGRGSQRQFNAADPPDPANYEDLFLYYTHAKSPYKFRMQTLPWEVLCYVVSHKTSDAERRWAFATYGNNIKKLGEKYHDVPYKTGNPPPLAEKPYTLSNMKQYGGVCTCRADFALALCRTLTVPAFYGGAGFPKYYGGHSWIMWLELHDIQPNSFRFTFENCGRYSNRKDYVSQYKSPHTKQEENDGMVLLRFYRLGVNISAARHSEILTLMYPMIVDRMQPSFQEQLKLLLDINAVSPGSPYVWKEIAKFSRENQFTKRDVPKILQLYSQLLNEFADSPNYLPPLVSDLLSASEIKDQREKLYARLFAQLDAKKRPDLILAAVRDFARAELDGNNEDIALKNLANAALKYYEEASLIAPVLNMIEQIVENGKKENQNKISVFYTRFLDLVLKKTSLPKDYRLDMLKRADACFGKYNQSDLQARAKSEIQKLEQAQPK